MPYFGVPIRNGLPIGLGSQAGFGIAPFDPRDLFSAGEQGAWYDPSDLTTLFTDSAGTTPVTAVEQFVGLMLDKSKGAPTTLGAELINNSAWFAQTGWSVNPSTGVATGAAVTGYIRNNGAGSTPITVGKWYQATIRLVSYTSGSVGYPYDGSGFVAIPNVPGTYTYRFLCDTPDYTYVFGTGFTGVIDNISVRELPGNHATSTGTKRPKLAARYNLLTYSEDIGNSIWLLLGSAGSSRSLNATTAPNGTNTADKLIVGTVTGAWYVANYADPSVVSGVSYTFSVYLKAAELGYAFVRPHNNSANFGASGFIVNLSDGTITYPTAPAAPASIGTATNVGNGWWRVTATNTANLTTATTGGPGIWPTNSTSFSNSGGTAPAAFTGDGTSGIFIWGADLRPASQATGLIGPTYQRVVDAATYDTVGFLPYLAFDGVDDSMSTGSIDFTATDKMTVFAGVRKLSDAARGMIVELSSTYGNAGTFAISGPGGASPTYEFAANGNPSSGTGAWVPSDYPAPITNVLTSSVNLAGASLATQIIPRINGVISQPGGIGSANGGNFGNYPLYIGQRAASSLSFNGWMSSLIIRGAQSTDSQISATESWVNGKTGAF